MSPVRSVTYVSGPDTPYIAADTFKADNLVLLHQMLGPVTRENGSLLDCRSSAKETVARKLGELGNAPIGVECI
jgi:hypothetical protein